MKSTKKALLLLLCAALMVSASVFGTLAYLTDTEAVTNTFSVGSVGLSLDEADVKPDGTYESDATVRVQENTYHLLPGHTYIKDPVIHVDAKSEDSYIFVKVDNAIALFEAATGDGYTSIEDQIEENGWTPLDGVENVYYQTYAKGQGDKDLEVFANFKIDGMANTVAGWDTISPETTKVNITGYAVQRDGFGSAKAAWDATFALEADAVVVTTAEEFEAALKAGGTVKLGASFGYSHMSDPYALTSDIILDLNGKSLSVSSVFYACRNMTIMDSQGGGKLNAANIWAQDGVIRITGGSYNCALAGSSTCSYTITGGKFRSDPSRFVPDTHTVTNSDGWYTVTAK